jgi:hypothetical protein
VSIPLHFAQASPTAKTAPHGPPLARQPIFVAKAISDAAGVFDARSIEVKLHDLLVLLVLLVSLFLLVLLVLLV